jgi:putative sigma-54 modulation protein
MGPRGLLPEGSMNIAITFRHLESSDAIKQYAQEKIGRLQKFLRKPMKATVTLSIEKGEQMAEVQVTAGSEHYTAKETSENMYASLDRVCDKLEHQVNNAKGKKLAATSKGMKAHDFAAEQERLAAANEE